MSSNIWRSSALALVALLFFAVSPALGQTPVMYITFEEGSGTTAADSSGNSHDGTLNGGAAWTTGVIGGGMQFNGVDAYVQIPNFDLGGNEFTVSWWFAENHSGDPNLWPEKENMFGWGTAPYAQNAISVWLSNRIPVNALLPDVEDANDYVNNNTLIEIPAATPEYLSLIHI